MIGDHRDVLEYLAADGLIDYASPMWLDLDHLHPRKFFSHDVFFDKCTEVDGDFYYVPEVGDKTIPVTVLDVPVRYSRSSPPMNVPFLATVRPLTPVDVGLELEPVVRDDASFDSPFQRLQNQLRRESAVADDWNKHASGRAKVGFSIDELVAAKDARFTEHGDVFRPHLLGVYGWDFEKTVFFYPFNSIDSPVDRFLGLVNDSLHEAALHDDVFAAYFARDSGVTVANRMKYSLDDFIDAGYVRAQPRVGSLPVRARSSKVRDIVFDAVVRKSLAVDGARKVHYESLSESFLSGELAVSYVPLSVPDFGSEVFSDVSKKTFPVALANFNSLDGVRGIFNYGMFVHFDYENRGVIDDYPLSMTVVPWSDKDFAIEVSRRISDLVSVPVTPVYLPAPKKNILHGVGLCSLDPVGEYKHR